MNELDLPSRWIIARFYETLRKVGQAIEEFHYSEAEILIQDFFWGNYCDWYLELIKAKFNDPNIQKTALFILKNSLKMMHPFIPFVTEEIYSKMNSKDECLSLAHGLSSKETLIDIACECSECKRLSISLAPYEISVAQWNIKPNETVDAFIVPADSSHARIFISKLY